MADNSKQTGKILMKNRIDEHLISATITEIEWERIHMHLTVKVDYSDRFDPSKPLDFYLVAAFLMANAKYKAERLDEHTYRLSLNVTNTGAVMCVPTGTYTIYACQGTDILCAPEVAPELAPKLQEHSRTFLHNNKTKGYCVNFSVTEDEEDLGIILNIMDLTKSGLKVFNVDDRQENNPTGMAKFKKNLHKRYVKAGRRFMIWDYNTSHDINRLFRGKNAKPTILFMSEQSEKLGTNIMSVADRMVERGMDKDYDIIYSARATVANPHYGIPSWLKVLWKMAKSDMIFIDDHAPILDWIFLNEDTTLIQLWHAGAGFKSSGYSRWGHTGCPAPNGCHRQYKYGIAGSRHIAHFFSEVWGINTENVLPTGMPRMDEFLDPDYRAQKEKELLEQFPMIDGKRVILFAPTYRGKNHFDAHYPYNLIDFDRLYEFCGDDTVVLFKMHPWVSEPVPIKKEHSDKFVDVNKYPNINDLFYKTDLLITDYSSNIFEFSLMRKPMLFFAFDEIQYSFSRGFHRDYEESAPGKVCHTFDEVMTALENEDFDYEKVEEYVDVHFDYIDSGASDRVIDWIVLGNIPEDLQADIKAVEDGVELLRHLDFSSLTPREETDDEEEKQDTHD